MLPEVFSDRLVFVPFGPALRSDTYLAWKKGARLSPAAAALVARVRDAMDAHPATRGRSAEAAAPRTRRGRLPSSGAFW